MQQDHIDGLRPSSGRQADLRPRGAMQQDPTDRLRPPVACARSARPLRPIVLYFGRLGDMVMLTAMLQFLHRRYRMPCYVVAAGSWAATVFEGNSDVARVWSFDRHFPFPLCPGWRQTWHALRESHPGPIYICDHAGRHLPRIRRMLALSRVDPARCLFIRESPQTTHHSVDRLLHFAEQTPEILKATDYPAPGNSTCWMPRLQVLDADRADLRGWLAQEGWTGRPIVLVQPGNHRSMGRRRRRWERLRTDDKAWPMDRWVCLLRKMHEHMPDAVIMLRGAHKEVRMLRRIRQATGLDCVVAVAVDLRRFFALCEACHSMVSVDTGPAHAAAALGLPLVVMYGAGPQRFWLPRSISGSAVVGVGGPPESMRVDQIGVDAVFNAWCEVVDKHR